MKKQIFVFGNPDLEMDSLPIRILPELQKIFPEIEFEVLDPNEEWEIPAEITIIDTVEDISKPQMFYDLKNFRPPPRLTMHDFDAYSNLRHLQKIGKLKKITVIAIPPNFDPMRASLLPIHFEKMRGAAHAGIVGAD
ncbi:hypothetical protein HYW53_02210 [Candidatus Giovannonibacteria bacterium]|nr:hypothetical protein [Candidatus Giovannonibacteria bacterium]